MKTYYTQTMTLKNRLSTEQLLELSNVEGLRYEYQTKPEVKLTVYRPYAIRTWYDHTKGEAVYEIVKLPPLYSGVISFKERTPFGA